MTENNFYNHSKDSNSLKSEIYPVIRSICTVGNGSIEKPHLRVCIGTMLWMGNLLVRHQLRQQ